MEHLIFIENHEMSGNTLIILTTALSTAFISIFLMYWYYASKLRLIRGQMRELMSANQNLAEDLNLAENTTRETEEERDILRSRCQIQSYKLDTQNERIKDLLNDQEKWEKQFELLAGRVIKQQSETLLNKQVTGIENILNPLKERIKSFEDKIEKTNVESIKRHTSLKEQIGFLSQKSEQVSQDAVKLAKALKGDFKKQGHWGELILESILEKSGLEKDREYYTQQSERDDEGKLKRPDVIIKLPDSKIIIVDSKVSLSAYSELVNTENDEEALMAQKRHSLAIRNHIDGLSEKRYHDLYKVESPDFVLMFIPIDTAFSAALEHDGELYNYAFEKNIVIVTASTLLATLKTVDTMWRNDKHNRHALKIADEAGKMYDKFVGFINDMDKMGNQLKTVSKTYDESMKKLCKGNGNLVTRAEKMREMGAKATKQLAANNFDLEK
jgi:DNA recombination protein RmuC